MLKSKTMKKILIISIMSVALPLTSCDKKSGSDKASLKDNSVGSAPTATISEAYGAFAKEADSITCALDSKVASYNETLDMHGRRRHIVRQRRELIQVHYRLDKLCERLQKHNHDYQAAVEALNRIEKDNPAFIRQYKDELHLVESRVAALLKDTLN